MQQTRNEYQAGAYETAYDTLAHDLLRDAIVASGNATGPSRRSMESEFMLDMWTEWVRTLNSSTTFGR
eukprot:4684404-Karenia_brevis.AAC.1